MCDEVCDQRGIASPSVVAFAALRPAGAGADELAALFADDLLLDGFLDAGNPLLFDANLHRVARSLAAQALRLRLSAAIDRWGAWRRYVRRSRRRGGGR